MAVPGGFRDEFSGPRLPRVDEAQAGMPVRRGGFWLEPRFMTGAPADGGRHDPDGA